MFRGTLVVVLLSDVAAVELFSVFNDRGLFYQLIGNEFEFLSSLVFLLNKASTTVQIFEKR